VVSNYLIEINSACFLVAQKNWVKMPIGGLNITVGVLYFPVG
jgi:hypothetical protein